MSNRQKTFIVIVLTLVFFGAAYSGTHLFSRFGDTSLEGFVSLPVGWKDVRPGDAEFDQCAADHEYFQFPFQSTREEECQMQSVNHLASGLDILITLGVCAGAAWFLSRSVQVALKGSR
ncbi:MAG: hypothetical protein JWL89_225 [Candidatus Saccharibacteria bacterium]|jgi:hypothetical protein|nr:hypothetical protein [Candidatus Saccharibacteria bacterium]